MTNKEFDYEFLKLGVSYTKNDKQSIEDVFKKYKKDVKLYKSKSISNDEGEQEDNSSQSKQFVWDICGDVIINRLLEKNNYSINIPVISENTTNIYWQGDYYELKTFEIEEDDI